MQDPSLYSQIVQQPQPQFPEQEQLKCPRCDSTNTKFCYYNNYNLSQPRYFCKNCRRYWTKGGALRNIPVGGGTRKIAKRSSSSSSSSSSSVSSKRPEAAAASSVPASGNKDDVEKINKGQGQFGKLTEASGGFGSGEGPFGNLVNGLGPNGQSLQINETFCNPGSGQELDPGLDNGSAINGYEFLNIQTGEGGLDWSGNSNGWPDLAINTPGSNIH